MSLINITNLTFCYDGSYDNVFENVSFQLDTDWKLGFIGRNGRGKTTFLRLLMGKETYSGKISSSVHFDYFPFEVSDMSKQTLDIVEEISSEHQLWELNRELSLLEVSDELLYRPFETLSNGEQTKVLLAVLFLKENNFLLIDEPTNHLDMEARETVSRYLKSKKGYIVVSHDRLFLDNCIDHVLSINKQNIDIQKGNFSSWWFNKQLQDEFELAENEKLAKDIKRLSTAAKRTSDWSDSVEKSKNQPLSSGLSADKGYIGHKSAKMMARSKAIEKRQQSAISDKSKLLKNLEDADSLLIKPEKFHSDRLVALSDISISYGEKTVCENISFTVNQGDRIALCGKNGCGKSSVLKLILGEDIQKNGQLMVASQLSMSYVSQDTSFLKGSLTDFAEENDVDESLFKAMLSKLDFNQIQFEKKMEDYSGGQKKKVLIAKSICDRSNLYIWDEPLNFIDVLSRIQIENLILEHKPTMIFVEHDSAFCNNVATKKVTFGALL